MQNQRLKPRQASSMSHNVYCGYSQADHNILCQCRTMCSPFIGTENHTSSISHALSWSQLRARENPVEPIEHVVLGGLALVMLFLGMALV